MSDAEKKIVYVSYYTDKYKEAAKRLEKSLDNFELTHDIQAIKDDGWNKNVRKKPRFILEMLKKHKDCHAVVWIDADGDVVRMPDLFLKIKEDIAVRFLEWRSKGKRELLSGTVFWRNSENAVDALGKWIAAIDSDEKPKRSCPEQEILNEILARLPITVHKLPKEYCHIIPKQSYRSGVDSDIVIAHYQFSRSTRYGRTPAKHLSQETKVSKGSRRSAPKKSTIAKPVKKMVPHHVAIERQSSRPKSRVPAALLQQERRNTIAKRRTEKNAKKVEALRTQKAIKLTAAARSKPAGIDKVRRRMYGLDSDVYVGGVRGHPPNHIQQRCADEAMAEKYHAAVLDGELKDHNEVIALGNSETINVIPPELLDRMPVVGCNRALRYEAWPDYLVMGDREPYCQEFKDGRLQKAAESGVKLILSDSIFDPGILLRGPYSNMDRRAQPLPDFPMYLYRIGPRCKKTWSYDLIARGSKKLPVNVKTFARPVVSCLNVVGSLLATAAILGAKKIYIAGVELKWPDHGPSHFFGDGKEVGAYQQDGSMKQILPSLKILRNHMKKHGIQVINLSPVKDSPFATVFKPHSSKALVKKLKGMAPWKDSDGQ